MLGGTWARRIVAFLLSMCTDAPLLLGFFGCSGFLRTFIASRMLISDASKILVLLALNMILSTSFPQYAFSACSTTMSRSMIVDFTFCSNLICSLLHAILYEFYYFVTSVNFIILFISKELHKIVENYI